jgi:hypothetical protein
MKNLFLLTLFSTGFLNSFSQSLTGEWEGSFTAYFPSTTIVNGAYKNDMKIEFILNNDSTYTIYSYAGEPYARGNFTDHKCEVTYMILSDENIFLEETKVIQPENTTTCLKKMNLKIVKRKKNITLEGSWQTTYSNCDNKGEILLYKKL